jgi:hypothetical protein
MEIKEEVAKNIVGAGSAIQNIVIAKLASIEIDRRAKLILDAYTKLDVLDKEIKKLGIPDQKSFVGNPPVEQKSFSAGRYELLGKTQEMQVKLKTACDNALNSNTAEMYQKLSETIAKAGNVGKDTKGSTDDSQSATD